MQHNAGENLMLFRR